jgi:putative addiction module component (TIGR02574 family)
MDSRKKADRLSTSEKILELQDQWDEIAGSPEDLDLTPEQLEELQRRLKDHRQNHRTYKTWEEVRAELEGLGRHDAD